MAGVEVSVRAQSCFSPDSSCGALLRELQCIWADIGESEADKDRMLSELEREFVEVFQRRIEQASSAMARLHQTVAAKEAELAALVASLGEHSLHAKTDKRLVSLKEQLALVTPLLEDLKEKKEERTKQIADIQSQIEKISTEMTEYMHQNGTVANPVNVEENDLSIRKLSEYQTQLRSLQKEKSDRLNKVLDHVNKVHALCGVLGMDFQKTVDEVHPSLNLIASGQSTNISNTTLEGLAQIIVRLKTEKKIRTHKLQEAVESLFQLWDLMDSPEEEKSHFGRLACILESSDTDMAYSGLLSLEIIEQTETEVERLNKLKDSRMKELVLKRRLELEEMCRRAHTEPDMNTAPEKTNALMDSGLVDPSELLANLDAQIVKAKEDATSRKDIMDRIDKWLAACDEENWLEEYHHDQNRYNAGRGGHLYLKRAEKARIAVTKIPVIVDNLMKRTFAWENKTNTPFLYDGVRLVVILEEYKLNRQQKEEEKRQFWEQKKLQGRLPAEKKSIHGSKPSPKRSNSYNREGHGYPTSTNGKAGFMTPSPRRVSVGSATTELLTPRSYSGHQNGYFGEMKRFSTGLLNLISLSKEDSSSTFTSISGTKL